GVSSLAVHLLAVGAIIVGGLLTAKVASNGRPPEIIPALPPDAGDEGADKGQSGSMATKKETALDLGPATNGALVPAPVVGALVPVKSKALQLDQVSTERTIGARSQTAVKDLAQQAEEALQQAGGPQQSVGGPAGKGGPPDGSDDGTLITDKRRKRWQ